MTFEISVFCTCLLRGYQPAARRAGILNLGNMRNQMQMWVSACGYGNAEELRECSTTVVHAAVAVLQRPWLQHLRLLELLSPLPAGQHAGTAVRVERLGVLQLLNPLQGTVAAGIQLGDHPRGQHEVNQVVFGHPKKKVIKFVCLLNR